LRRKHAGRRGARGDPVRHIGGSQPQGTHMRHRIGHGVECPRVIRAHPHFGIIIEIKAIFRRIGRKIGGFAPAFIAP